MTADPVRLQPGGILVDIRLTPRGGKDAIEGALALSDGRRVLAARVRAVPEKGAANAALVALVAAAFGVAKGDVAIVSGPTARVKTLRIAGETDSLATIAAALFG